jgi:hypothetical protein
VTKRIIPILLILFLHSSHSRAQEIKFETKKHDFGFVRQGDVLEYDFAFINTGTKPLLIDSTQATCSCTEVETPPNPILPGEKAKIHLKFDSKSAIDRQKRKIIVYSNSAQSPQTLIFKCIVLEKKE